MGITCPTVPLALLWGISYIISDSYTYATFRASVFTCLSNQTSLFLRWQIQNENFLITVSDWVNWTYVIVFCLFCFKSSVSTCSPKSFNCTPKRNFLLNPLTLSSAHIYFPVSCQVFPTFKITPKHLPIHAPAQLFKLSQAGPALFLPATDVQQ